VHGWGSDGMGAVCVCGGLVSKVRDGIKPGHQTRGLLGLESGVSVVGYAG
jgi:hypothetical protein